MIHAGIVGGSEPMAGELIRILINHPDVDIAWVNSLKNAGRAVADVHHGLVGETSLRLSANPDLASVNTIFLCRGASHSREFLAEHPVPPEVRIIDLSPDFRDPSAYYPVPGEFNAMISNFDPKQPSAEFIYGLPELNRKAMVRGGTRVALPHPAAHVALLALLPLAKQQLLSTPLSISILMPHQCEPIESTDALRREISDALAQLQTGFSAPINIEVLPSDDERAITARIFFESGTDIGTLNRIYEEFYDDHNFTYPVNFTPATREVTGTNKCLIHVDKAEGRVIIKSVMDAIDKGAAGSAVHAMNLLWGLHERIGLALKASRF